MKLLAAALALALASCATAPRAILPPPSVIAELDVAPVVTAGRATQDAVREVAGAGQATREAGRKVSDTTRRLSESIARAEALAAANDAILAALADTSRLAEELEANVAQLSAALAFAEEREKIAIETVEDMDDIIDQLQADHARQSAQISQSISTEKTLREQVNALAESADKRVIAEEKLRWWKKAALITWGIATAYLIILFFGGAIRTYLRTIRI